MGKRKRKRKRRKSAGPTLFDLPLHGAGGRDAGGAADAEIRPAEGAPPPDRAEAAPPAASGPEPPPAAGLATRGPSILFDNDTAGASRLDRLKLDGGATTPVKPDAEPAAMPGARMIGGGRSRSAPPADDKAFLGDRLLGGLADLAAQLIALGLAIAATHALGVVVTIDDWEPFGVLALVFSFLYWMVPLAFWGQTPGMAWVGHTARSTSGEPLSFGQTFMRWLGSIVTLAFAGLPLLIALTGRSLTDRVSNSRTLAT